jgi:hypothetical protein
MIQFFYDCPRELELDVHFARIMSVLARTGRVLQRLGAGLVPGCFAVWRSMLDLGVDLSPY